MLSRRPALNAADVIFTLPNITFIFITITIHKLTCYIAQAQQSFLEVAKRIGALQKECGLLMPVGDYAEQFHFSLMEVVFEWARGMVCIVD